MYGSLSPARKSWQLQGTLARKVSKFKLHLLSAKQVSLVQRKNTQKKRPTRQTRFQRVLTKQLPLRPKQNPNNHDSVSRNTFNHTPTQGHRHLTQMQAPTKTANHRNTHTVRVNTATALFLLSTAA